MGDAGAGGARTPNPNPNPYPDHNPNPNPNPDSGPSPSPSPNSNQALQRWLRTAAAALHTPLYFRFVHCPDAAHDGSVGMAVRRLGFERLAVSPVVHSFDAWAVAVQHREGWSLVYSGDTRPCEGVVRLGRSLRPTARILVHEVST